MDFVIATGDGTQTAIGTRYLTRCPGCPKLAAVTRNMTDAVSIRKFCVEQQDDINCDLPTQDILNITSVGEPRLSSYKKLQKI